MTKKPNAIDFLREHLACDCNTCSKKGTKYCEDHFSDCLACNRALKELENMANRLQEYDDAHESGRMIVLPEGFENAKEFFQVVYFPSSCSEDSCEGCEYAKPSDCTFEPYIRKAEPSAVYRARLELTGLNITEDAAIKELVAGGEFLSYPGTEEPMTTKDKIDLLIIYQILLNTGGAQPEYCQQKINEIMDEVPSEDWYSVKAEVTKRLQNRHIK